MLESRQEKNNNAGLRVRKYLHNKKNTNAGKNSEIFSMESGKTSQRTQINKRLLGKEIILLWISWYNEYDNEIWTSKKQMLTMIRVEKLQELIEPVSRKEIGGLCVKQYNMWPCEHYQNPFSITHRKLASLLQTWVEIFF